MIRLSMLRGFRMASNPPVSAILNRLSATFNFLNLFARETAL
jgi:hypothetical protein